MSAIVWANVLALAPELSSIGVQAQTFALWYVNSRVGVNAFDGEAGHATRLARIYLAAHLGSSVGAGTVAGPVIAESGGGLAEQYQPLATSAMGSLGESRYGREYLRLVRSSPNARGPMVL